MKALKQEWPYYIAVIIIFYVFPLLIMDTGSAMTVLLVFIPILCLAVSCLYGYRYGFHIQLALASSILFLPSIYLYYNSSAGIYSIAYGVIVLIGTLIGTVTQKLSRHT